MNCTRKLVEFKFIKNLRGNKLILRYSNGNIVRKNMNECEAMKLLTSMRDGFCYKCQDTKYCIDTFTSNDYNH